MQEIIQKLLLTPRTSRPSRRRLSRTQRPYLACQFYRESLLTSEAISDVKKRSVFHKRRNFPTYPHGNSPIHNTESNSELKKIHAREKNIQLINTDITQGYLSDKRSSPSSRSSSSSLSSNNSYSSPFSMCGTGAITVQRPVTDLCSYRIAGKIAKWPTKLNVQIDVI